MKMMFYCHSLIALAAVFLVCTTSAVSGRMEIRRPIHDTGSRRALDTRAPQGAVFIKSDYEIDDEGDA
ncbi:hypothetical protein DFH09DRAFT_1311817 [Mycena vulgaris]|nr:hypothetical protein DFH09DRAFT_1311817 [Mycena vulgaris]